MALRNLDHPELATERAAFEARLDSLGLETVKSMLLNGAFPTNHNIVINEWLAGQSIINKPKRAGK